MAGRSCYQPVGHVSTCRRFYGQQVSIHLPVVGVHIPLKAVDLFASAAFRQGTRTCGRYFQAQVFAFCERLTDQHEKQGDYPEVVILD